MSRLSEYFTDTPTNASVAFAAAAFGALVGNLTEGLPRWAIASLVVVGVLAFSLALGRQIYLRKRRSPRRVVSLQERALRDHWYTVNRDELGQHAAAVHHAAVLKWNAKNVHWDDIVKWGRKGTPDPSIPHQRIGSFRVGRSVPRRCGSATDCRRGVLESVLGRDAGP